MTPSHAIDRRPRAPRGGRPGAGARQGISRPARAGVVGLLALVYVLVPYRWATAHAHHDAAAAATANRSRVGLQVRIAHARDVQSHPQTWTALRSAVTAAFPGAADVSGVLAGLRAVAASSGALLVSFDATPPPSSAPPTVPAPVAITVRVEGALAQIEGFLAGLRSMPRLVTTSAISLAEGETIDATLTSAVWVGPPA